MKRFSWLLLIPALACSESPPVKQVQQVIEVMPSELVFGDVPVLGGRLINVEVKNLGQSAASVRTRINGPFEVEPGEFTVGVGASQEVGIRFRPTAPVEVDGEILFQAGGGFELDLPASGRGVERAIRIDPERIDFGPVSVGD